MPAKKKRALRRAKKPNPPPTTMTDESGMYVKLPISSEAANLFRQVLDLAPKVEAELRRIADSINRR